MKFKRLISGVIVAAVCTLCVFNLVTCGEKIQAKILPFKAIKRLGELLYIQ